MGLTDPNPHDLAAEAAVIGDMIALPATTADIAQHLTSSDFFDRRCAILFDGITAAHRQGRTVDPVALTEILRQAGQEPDPGWLHDIVTAGSGAWRTHVDIVTAMRHRRQIIRAATEAIDAARTGNDPWDVSNTLTAHLAATHRPNTAPPDGLVSIDEFIDRPDTGNADWVIDGLLRRGWRCVIVGTEGGGKSMLFRQIAVLAAQGVHPLKFQPIAPCRALIVDLENPEDNIARSCRALREGIDPTEYEMDRAWLWHQPAGIDIRSRAGQAALEAAISAVRPDLVTLGPLYKAYRRRGQESDEEAAGEVQAALDDLRTRYGFALLLEHHAGQDQAGYRKLRPYGSSLWLRWPEMGLALQPDNRNEHRKSITIERWRGDRMSNDWPDYLDEGDRWPWLGVWKGGNANVIEFPGAM